jgi:acetyl-CoA carboxylase biotin carboxylase subunit
VSALDQAAAAASATGYPIVLKAAAGGGGRGITLVRGPDELREAFSTTRATARAVFGDDRVYVEKYVDACRHIEIQVIADAHGEVIHLGERDCSVQRFYQKLVEESPAPGLPAASRARAAEAAVRGAAVLGLRGAATFEFLAEPDGAVHFIEVNARLQVEHPVTEMVTGLDIVREQLLVAGGERLSVTQDEVAVRGAAIECRINAEDPAGRFRPAAGRLAEFRLPGGPWTRVDTGYEAGSVIPRFYDSLIAKVIVWAPDREQAIRRADRALGELRADGPGVATTTGFLRRVLREPAFRAGRHTTGLVAEMLSANDHNGAVHDH